MWWQLLLTALVVFALAPLFAATFAKRPGDWASWMATGIAWLGVSLSVASALVGIWGEP